MNPEPTVLINGIMEDLTPIAYKAAKTMKEEIDQHNADPDHDIQGTIDLLGRHNVTLLHAITELEILVRNPSTNPNAGKF